MNPYILVSIVTLFFSSCKASAQLPLKRTDCRKEFDSLSNQFVYTEVDIEPAFRGGNSQLLEYFHDHYSVSCEDDFEGRFKFVIVISADGSIKDVRIRGKSKEQLSSGEKVGLMTLLKMPKWQPGVCNGIRVPVKMDLVIYL